MFNAKLGLKRRTVMIKIGINGFGRIGRMVWPRSIPQECAFETLGSVPISQIRGKDLSDAQE